MNILALDLGSKTGWALYHSDVGATGPVERTTSGTWSLVTSKELAAMRKAKEDRCCDPRFKRLSQEILTLQKAAILDYIYFEDVQFMVSLAQAQLWAGFRAIVTMWHPRIKVRTVPTGTLKKFATGNGAAKKELMAATLENQIGLKPEGRDDNEIDALHLLNFALTELKLK